MQSAHKLLVLLFATLNTAMLYLFLLHLPLGFDSLALSFRGWSEAMPRIAVVAALAVVIGIIGVLLTRHLGDLWKTRLVFFKWRHAHPGYNAFWGGKSPRFERKPLRDAHPEVKDSAYDPEVQFALWSRLHAKHAELPAVAGTLAGWQLMRDLTLVAQLFLVAYLICWPLNRDVVPALGFVYLYIFGAQALFLLLSARGVGRRMVFNILALELGIGLKKPEDKNKRRRWMGR